MPSLVGSEMCIRDSGTTAGAHQPLPLCDDHGRCICVLIRAMFPVDLGNTGRNEHRISRGAIDCIGCCSGGRTILTHTCSGISKTTAQSWYTQQHKRYSISVTAPALQTLAFVTATALLCLYVCAVSPRYTRHHGHISTYLYVQLKNNQTHIVKAHPVMVQ